MLRPAPEGEPTEPPESLPPRWVQVLTVLVVAVAVPALLVAFTIQRNPAFSRLDEPAHSDYLRRIEQGEVPRVGDRMLEQTVEDVQCRTVQGRTNAPCGLPSYHYDLLGAGGYQYEAQQPPLYYAITALLRQPARLGPADDFVTTARVTGIAWLTAGLLVFFLACRRLGCRWWPTALVTLLLGIGPGVVYQTSTINNDAAAVLTGSAALLMFTHLRRDGTTLPRVAIWSAVAVALVLVKPTGVVSVAAAVGALLLDALLDRHLTLRHAVGAVVPLLAGLVTYGVWGVVRDARGTVDYDVVLEALLSFKMTERFPLDDVGSAIDRFVFSYAPGGLPTTPDFVTSPATIVVLALAAAAIASLWTPGGGSGAQRTGAVAMLALVVGGPAFTVLFYVDYSIRGGPTSRYGLSLLPLLFVAGAATYRTRRAMAVLAVLGAVLLVPLVIATGWPTTRIPEP
jgi:hypothetical protein